jgi:uncharacterized protein
MDPRVQLITLGVPDVAVARRFYAEGLGWPTTFDVPGEITFIQVGPGLLLGLFNAASLDGDVGRSHGSAAAAPITLAQVVPTEHEVREILDAAAAAGATIVKPPQRADFGGYHGYFADPAGFLWEIATNSGWSEAPDGTVSLGPITDD